MKSLSDFSLIIATERSVAETKLLMVLESLLGSVVPAHCTLSASTYDPSTTAIAAVARKANLSTHRVTVPKAGSNRHIVLLRINERLAADAQGCLVLWDGKDGRIKHLVGAAQFHGIPVWSFPLD